MQLNLLIDGGMTSTKVYLIEKETKKILKHASFLGINPYTHEKLTLNELEKIKSDFLNYDYQNVYFGAPGITEYDEKNNIYKIFSTDFVKKENIHILTDIEIQELMFCTGDNYLALSLGSGSIFVENISGKKRFLSGFGPIISDEGSTFSFSRLFFREAICDYEKGVENSPYIKYCLAFLKINEVEDIKRIYADWNEIKPLFLRFAKFIFLESYKDIQEAVNKIIDKLSHCFFEYLDATRINPQIKNIFIFGGMAKNDYYRNLLTKGFELRGFKVIFK